GPDWLPSDGMLLGPRLVHKYPPATMGCSPGSFDSPRTGRGAATLNVAPDDGFLPERGGCLLLDVGREARFVHRRKNVERRRSQRLGVIAVHRDLATARQRYGVAVLRGLQRVPALSLISGRDEPPAVECLGGAVVGP